MEVLSITISLLLLLLFFVNVFGKQKLGNNGFGLIKGTKKKNASGANKPTSRPSTNPPTTMKPIITKKPTNKVFKCDRGKGNKNKVCRPTQSPTVSYAPSTSPSVSQKPSPVYKKKYNLGKVKVPYYKNINKGKGSNGHGNNNHGIEKGKKKQIKKGNNNHGIIKGKKYRTPTKKPVEQPKPTPKPTSAPTTPPPKPPKKKKPLGKMKQPFYKNTKGKGAKYTRAPTNSPTKWPTKRPTKRKPLGKVKVKQKIAGKGWGYKR